ncbi:2TM domain-containing protein [Flavobacteriaceae bacterium TK19130]|nr:2TM domain-containing protein [Thermobacterium salinum]
MTVTRFFKEVGKAFFVGLLIFIVLGVIQYLNGDRIDSGKEFLIKLLYNQLYSVVLYMANAVVIFYVLDRYKNLIFKFKNLWKAILGNITVTLLAIFLLRFLVDVVFYGQPVMEFLSDQRLDYYLVSFIISMVVASIFYAFYYYKFNQERKVKEQKIIAGTASAQFDALKNQLDPHFLFNSLNVLTSLIEENPDAATKFTTSLSKVYRYVLEQKNKQLVTLEEELRFASLYMSLLKMRFEDSIVYSPPETLENPEAKVVPLSLQLLLENAVKHNQVTPSKKLHITITEKDGALTIENNFQPKQVVKESSGVGLQNIHKRYGLLTNRPVHVGQQGTHFKVQLPLLTKEAIVRPRADEFISEKRYERAKEKVEKLKGFYIHFTIYLCFVPVFIYLNYISGTSFPWAMFPIGGWGLGVAGHAIEVFNWNPFLGKDWEERKIRELMNKDE